MILETIETDGLAQLSYLVGDESSGECAVVDPRRDVSTYLRRARALEVRITAVLETHVHADFVSGSRELAARTGAPIYTGVGDDYDFERRPLEDGDEIRIGDYVLRALHTPGHSPEHACFTLRENGNEGQSPWAVFTGDTLFAGSVGRPDLASESSAEELARKLYHSIQDQLLPLGDDVIVYPGHGAGSPCGSQIGDRDLTTLGYERRTNEKLQASDEDDFVRAVLGDLPEEPRYYSRMKKINGRGPPVSGDPEMPPSLSPERFREMIDEEKTRVVDTRDIVAFAGAHVEGALNLALRSAFPVWAGWTLGPDDRVLLILEDVDHLELVRRQLFRIGLDRIEGYLQGGMRRWIESGLPLEHRWDLSVRELRGRLTDGGGRELEILDVRSQSEWEEGHIPGARHLYAPYLEEGMDELGLQRDVPVVVYCGTGYRASLAASLLQRNGFEDVRSVPGGMTAWRAEGYELENSG